MRTSYWAASLAGALLLSGCVVLPTAPMVTVLPGQTKGFDQFRIDEGYCRGYAQSIVAGPTQAASNTAAANAAASTAFGAATGAIIGSASGSAGPGAAIGAGAGLLFGSLASANALGYSSYQLQRQYDGAYIQCMYARGNRVPMRVYGAYGGGYAVERYPAASAPTPAYPPPNPSLENIPPPNTPPPRL